MINLSVSGLPLAWDEEGKSMVFEKSLPAVEPAVRRLQEMQDVLYEKGKDDPPRGSPAQELYYMFRGVSLAGDEETFAARGIRYDITVLVPGKIGREYVKTAGHYHPVKPGTSFTYPEVYEVIHGRAYYLVQKPHDLQDPRKGLEQILVVEAQPGDKVLIPPGFGHVTINPAGEFLVMSNLVAAGFSSLYEPIKKMGGAGYFCLASEDSPHAASFVPNPTYPSLPPLVRGRPRDLPSFSLKTGAPLYQAFLEAPADFAFLK